MFKCCKAGNGSFDKIDASQNINFYESNQEADNIIDSITQAQNVDSDFMNNSTPLDQTAFKDVQNVKLNFSINQKNPTPDIDEITVTEFHKSKYYKSTNIYEDGSQFSTEEPSQENQDNILLHSVRSQKQSFGPIDVSIQLCSSAIVQDQQKLEIKEQKAQDLYIQQHSQQYSSASSYEKYRPQRESKIIINTVKNVEITNNEPDNSSENSSYFSLHNSDVPIIEVDESDIDIYKNTIRAEDLQSTLPYSQINQQYINQPINQITGQNSLLQTTTNYLSSSSIVDQLTISSLTTVQKVAQPRKTKAELMQENQLYRTQKLQSSILNTPSYPHQNDYYCKPLKIKLLGVKTHLQDSVYK
ncbi:hypothetical protein SS50377_24742 [Spironucleus salmonicida]|uniref:Uncharacterized protein n=1 Tax=Spironucleus salmonicida TaxID=348837 RepID=V6LJR8_9EUKA|nr:hypothetical protein SS50377_24742 [Spironucleus salmonicida]|eukprot:EST44623.1 Hypothetical protein SS50377_15628 [Spironucleus salmonicida]